jgi:hypothetical protein
VVSSPTSTFSSSPLRRRARRPNDLMCDIDYLFMCIKQQSIQIILTKPQFIFSSLTLHFSKFWHYLNRLFKFYLSPSDSRKTSIENNNPKSSLMVCLAISFEEWLMKLRTYYEGYNYQTICFFLFALNKTSILSKLATTRNVFLNSELIFNTLLIFSLLYSLQFFPICKETFYSKWLDFNIANKIERKNVWATRMFDESCLISINILSIPR